MNIYQQQILDHYHNPRNTEKPKEYTHSYQMQNLSCGDEIIVYLKITNGLVEQVGYEAEGCAISIAAASMLSDELAGKSVSEILKLDLEYMLSLMGIPLTMSRYKCATLGLEAVKAATSSSTE